MARNRRRFERGEHFAHWICGVARLVLKDGPMFPSRRRRLAWPTLVCAALLGAPVSAHAQSISLATTGVSREHPRPSAEKPESINYQDCSSSEVVSFALSLMNFSSLFIEIWNSSGADCSTEVERTGSEASCHKIQTLDANDDNPVIELTAEELLTGFLDNGCEYEGTRGAQPLNIYFLLKSSDSSIDPIPTAQVALWKSEFDLLGPAAPTGVKAGVGEEQLATTWTPTSDSDAVGYRLYCTAASGSDEDACEVGELVEGERPPDELECGSATGVATDDGSAVSLENGTRYAVAVAAIDDVGNVGPLSDVTCATPQPVDDFYETYRRAGGGAGGGYCAFGLAPLGSVPLFAAAVALAALARLARRKRSG
jgi:hypothetical protein